MSKVRTHSASTDLVPISERFRYMQLLRLGVAVVVLLASWVVPGALGAGFDKLALVTVAYVVASLVGEAIWRFTGRSAVLFGTLLIVDGLYLAWISYLTGGLISPFRFLILLHLISVALLASYRTGLMLALWHSVLLFIVFNAQQAGILNAPTDAIRALPGSEFQRIIAFSVALWLVTIATSTFSAINERELRRRRFDLERVQRMASTDGLTMIANRRTFDASMQREINRVSRSGEQLSLIMLDLDHFKKLNDTYGHQKGDDVLQRVARVLEDQCRDFDTVARYGGEEFGIIIPGTVGEEAVSVARRLAEAIRNCYEDITVTVSMGVASYPSNARDPEGLVAAADESLYSSKRGGRDRVTASTRQANVVDLEGARKSADGAA